MIFKHLIHKLKLRFGKKTKVAPPHIIYGVTHATDEALSSCWGGVTIQGHRKPNHVEARHGHK